MNKVTFQGGVKFSKFWGGLLVKRGLTDLELFLGGQEGGGGGGRYSVKRGEVNISSWGWYPTPSPAYLFVIRGKQKRGPETVQTCYENFPNRGRVFKYKLANTRAELLKTSTVHG